jgi:hypothetical protein
MGRGVAGAATSSTGSAPDHKMTQQELDEAERYVSEHTHLAAGPPETPCRRKEGPVSPVPPTAAPAVPTQPK